MVPRKAVVTVGYILHAAVIAGFASLSEARLGEPWSSQRAEDEAKLMKFRDSLPEQWRALVVGPVESVINGYAWVAFLTDGSKEGWQDSKLGARYRFEFQQLFGGLTVRWGDDPEPSVTWEQGIDDE